MTRPTPQWLITEKPRLLAMRVGEVIIIDSGLNHSTVWRQLQRIDGQFRCGSVDGGFRIERLS